MFHGLPEPCLCREKSYFPGFAGIAAGAVTALVVQGSPALPGRGLQALGAALMLAVLGWGDRVWARLGSGTLLVLVVGVCLVVAGSFARREVEPSPWTAPLRAYGRWSYEIYLTHMFVVFGALGVWRRMGLGVVEAGWLWGLVPGLAGVFGAAVGRFGSEPARRWIRARVRV